MRWNDDGEQLRGAFGGVITDDLSKISLMLKILTAYKARKRMIPTITTANQLKGSLAASSTGS